MKKELIKRVGFMTVLFLGISSFIMGSFNYNQKEEVRAAASCPDGFMPINDFCISEQNSEKKITEAIGACFDRNKGYSRLCSTAELLAAREEGVNGQSWVDDFIEADSERAAFIERETTDFVATPKSETRKFYCCRNL